jgi:DNA-binding XRE family transcriptional regulator
MKKKTTDATDGDGPAAHGKEPVFAMAQKNRKPFTATQAGMRVRARNQIVGAVTRAVRKRQRKTPALTQSIAAERLGITRQRMSTILNNAGNWTMDTIGDLIFAFDLQIEEIKIVLDEDLKVSNYVSPMSQASRGVVLTSATPSKFTSFTGNVVTSSGSTKPDFSMMAAPKATVTLKTLVLA